MELLKLLKSWFLYVWESLCLGYDMYRYDKAQENPRLNIQAHPDDIGRSMNRLM